MVDKRQLLGMTLEELKGVASEVSLPAYAAKQMADWIYKKKITRISEMTNIAVAKRALLEDSFEIGAYPPSEYQKSKDGTIKYLYAAGPGRFVESVYIPTDDRATLCVSSQVGCKMNCLYDGKTRLHGKPDSEPDIEPDPVFAGKRFIDEYRFHGNGGATG